MRETIIRCDQCGKEQGFTGEWNDSFHYLSVERHQALYLSSKKYHWEFCSDECLVKHFTVEEEVS